LELIKPGGRDFPIYNISGLLEWGESAGETDKWQGKKEVRGGRSGTKEKEKGNKETGFVVMNVECRWGCKEWNECGAGECVLFSHSGTGERSERRDANAERGGSVNHRNREPKTKAKKVAASLPLPPLGGSWRKQAKGSGCICFQLIT